MSGTSVRELSSAAPGTAGGSAGGRRGSGGGGAATPVAGPEARVPGAGAVHLSRAGEERYFALREIAAAVAFARDGGIAVHRNLDYSGTVIGGRSRAGPFLHVFGERAALLHWGRRYGMDPHWLQPAHGTIPPHFDVFGSRAERVLRRLGVSEGHDSGRGGVEGIPLLPGME
jgi:hypothetical protein